MTKQTAVEWLQKQLNENGKLTAVDFYQAEQMEKEQIKEAYWDGGQDVPLHGKQCEHYYNKIY